MDLLVGDLCHHPSRTPTSHLDLCDGAFLVLKNEELTRLLVSQSLCWNCKLCYTWAMILRKVMEITGTQHYFCIFSISTTMTSFSVLFFLCFFITLSSTDGVQLVVVNNCKETIWPGILPTAGHETPNNGGFRLYSSEQIAIDVPEKWSGRIWARRGCCFDQNSGKGYCKTGDCGGLLQCKGNGGTPPTTVVEMTFGTCKSDLHYYDVSLVDGFNIPVAMTPERGGGDGGACGVAMCEADLNVFCPSNLIVKKGEKVVACKSACLAAKSDRYCCTGKFANPKSCKPSIFGHLFKAMCPRAYSYAFDDLSGLKTCNASRYVITFCPPKL